MGVTPGLVKGPDMNANILDVLMYLFENYFEEEVILGPDQDMVKNDLMEEGFSENIIHKAFMWLEGLAPREDEEGEDLLEGPRASSLRHYSKEEEERLNLEARGFLLFIEQLGILDPVSRELVIDQLVALESDEIDMDQVKWVVQMVLFNQPGREAAFSRMENLIFSESLGQMH